MFSSRSGDGSDTGSATDRNGSAKETQMKSPATFVLITSLLASASALGATSRDTLTQTLAAKVMRTDNGNDHGGGRGNGGDHGNRGNDHGNHGNDNRGNDHGGNNHGGYDHGGRGNDNGGNNHGGYDHGGRGNDNG